MNGSFYQNPTFPINNDLTDSIISPTDDNIYSKTTNIEHYNNGNLLENNRGKQIKVFVSYPNSSPWQNKIYEGNIESSDQDYLVLSDSKTKTWYLIKHMNIDYVEFNEKINFNM